MEDKKEEKNETNLDNNDTKVDDSKETKNSQYDEALEKFADEEVTPLKLESKGKDKKIVELELINTPDSELTRRQKRRKRKYLKIIRYGTGEADIKYRGPLGIRGLRIVGWVLMALTAVSIAINIYLSFVTPSESKGILLESLWTVTASIGQLAVPCFMLARFAIVMRDKNKSPKLVLIYGLMSLAIIVAFFVVYFHYGVEIVKALTGETWSSSAKRFNSFFSTYLGRKISFNIFIDMFLWSVFFTFMNYYPKKIKDDKKKMLAFRLCAIIPFIIVLTTYIFKALHGANVLTIHPYFSPFLPVSSPLTFVIFMIISLLMAHHKKVFLSIGGTVHQYKRYLKSNASSFNVAKFTAISFALVGVVNLIIEIIILVFSTGDNAEGIISIMGLSDCVSYLLFSPFVLLFSSTREFKYGKVDVMVTIAGVGAFAVIVIEGGYRIILHLLSYVAQL